MCRTVNCVLRNSLKMFKFRRTAMRRCKENRRFAERSGDGDKRFKFEGNSNITSNRVTIPHGFLCLGIRSEKVQRRPFEQNFTSDRGFVLTEESLDKNVKENHKILRRSARISKKTEETHSFDHLTASEYCYKELRNSPVKENRKRDKNNGIVRNNSKSLFREIKERCARVQTKKSVDFNYPVTAVIDPYSKVEYFYPSVFCQSISRQVSLDLKQNTYLINSKLGIAEKIRDINDQLSGKINRRNSSPLKRSRMEMDDEPNNFDYVPRCEWVFQTPPRQRIVIPKADECAIQPALICTARKRSNIYEMHPKFKVDLTGFSNRQNVQVDRRYVQHLASFEEKQNPMGFGIEELDQDCLADVGGNFFEERNMEKEVTYSDSHSTVSNLFAQVTCRPTKTVKKKSRISKFYERRSEKGLEDTPTGPDLFQTVEEFERDITFIEDNGKFKIVNSQAPKSNEGFEFKFRKNLFKRDEDKMFNFDSATSNMFDFAKLKDN